MHAATISRQETTMQHADDKPILRRHELDIMAEEPMSAGALSWYAVRVAGREEVKIRYDLVRDGWTVFCPWRTLWVRPSRYTKKRVEKPFALIPRFLFVGFPANEGVPWLDVCSVDGVYGPLGNNGRPSLVRWAQMQALMDDVARGRWRAPNRDKRMIDKFLKVGDLVPSAALRLPVDVGKDLEVTGVRGVTAILSGLGLLGCDVITIDMRNIDRDKMAAG